jgi:pantetheine-phosphate adenylyltransferase
MTDPHIVRRALCPGSFDPVTNGHLDIIDRAAELYDELVVAVFVNRTKSSLFTADERREMLTEVTADKPNVRVDMFQGLVVDYCRDHQISVIVKGLRAISDFDYELQMAQANRGLAGIETLFMPTNPEYSFLASSLVKEIANWQGDVSALVPPLVYKRLMERAANRHADEDSGTDSAADSADGPR